MGDDAAEPDMGYIESWSTWVPDWLAGLFETEPGMDVLTPEQRAALPDEWVQGDPVPWDRKGPGIAERIAAWLKKLAGLPEKGATWVVALIRLAIALGLVVALVYVARG